jgi:hypothetical protein
MQIEKPGFHTPLTIKETIDAVYRKKYLLPAIQRDNRFTKDLKRKTKDLLFFKQRKSLLIKVNKFLLILENHTIDEVIWNNTLYQLFFK